MKSYLQFEPELVIEATSVCDRKCHGCYAPNITTNEDANLLFAKNPNLFLNSESLKNILYDIVKTEGQLKTISIRGGEPSRHPFLSDLLAIVSSAAQSVYLETHGQWILKDSQESENLLQSCQKNNVIIKISFDQMHGIATDKLRAITQKLKNRGIQFAVAITEASVAEFLETRLFCDWISDHHIIFQKKAFSSNDLIQPKLGVIRVDGSWSKNLTSKTAFSKNQSEVAV